MYKVVNMSAEGVGLVIELSIHSGHYAKSKQEITKHSVAEILLYISLLLYDVNCIEALTQITSGTTTTYKIAKRNLEPERQH
jgi:hypothetical protein